MKREAGRPQERDHVFLLGLETTFREKLEWLEEAETLSLRFKEQREARRNAVQSPKSD